ncbi:MBL fold metallo-hydrolase, partial [Enterococcus faecium]
NVKKLVLTDLPQFGDLDQLKNEAQKAAGKGIDVELAAVDKVLNI